MIRQNFLIILLSFVFFFLSCSVKQKDLSLINSEYVIDLDGEKETSIPLSAYFKNAKTIIVETKEDCLIGYINELQVFDEYIYVLDMFTARSLFVFDKNGRFIRKIGNIGNGPGEYIQLSGFTLDTENRFVFLLDYGQRIHKYSFDGTFVQTITPQLQKTNIKSIQYYRGKLYLSVLTYQPDIDDCMLIEADAKDGKILSESLPLKYNKGWTRSMSFDHGAFMSQLNDPPKYTQIFMDYIVSVGEKITPHIELKSKNLVVDNDLNSWMTDSGTNMLESFVRNFRGSSKVFDVHSYVENNDCIIFRYQCGFMVFKTAIYDKKTGTTKIADFLCNDILYKYEKKIALKEFVFSDTKGAYEILQGSMIEKFQESIRNNETLPELDKADELLKLDGESNPVIFYYEFK